METALTFDDILIVPSFSDIKSIQEEVLVTTVVGDSNFKFLEAPIISAAMDTITTLQMQKAMKFLGGLGIHHRYIANDDDGRKTLIYASNYGPIAVSPSMGTDFILELTGTNPNPVVAIDVAHGDRAEVINYAESCVRLGCEVWSGNIATKEAAHRYINAGVNVLKVGIGPGSACTTRVVSGVGVPQATAIQEVKSVVDEYRELLEVHILADGGIKSSGDIVKAIALGADAVIIGNLFAGTSETPGEVYESNHKGYFKRYRGMASREALEESDKRIRVEGVAGMVPFKGSVKYTFNELVEGIKTGFAYTGSRNILEFKERAQIIKISNAGVIEGNHRLEPMQYGEVMKSVNDAG